MQFQAGTNSSNSSPEREGAALQGDAVQDVGGAALPQHARRQAARGRALRQLLPPRPQSRPQDKQPGPKGK